MSTLAPTAPSYTDEPAAFAPEGAVINVNTGRRALPWGKILAALTILVTVVAGVGSYLHYAAGFVTTDDAFIDGNIHPISPRIGGTVARVLVDDNEHVQAGQPLVELDPADMKLAVQGAEADLAQARANEIQVAAQIARAQAGVEAAVAHIAQNTAELHRAEVDFHRMEQLIKDAGAISEQTFDAARAVFDAAQATAQSLIAERVSAEANLAAAEAQRAVAQAQVEKAAAVLSTAKLQADYTIIRAPSAGRIAKKSVEVGQRLQIAQPVMSVVSDRVWVVANFKESQLAHLRAGEKVRVTVDAIDGHEFAGVVDSFSPGTGAKFSLLPPDNSTGNFTKIVQRVPVKIVFSADSIGADLARLSPGLSAYVKVSVPR